MLGRHYFYLYSVIFFLAIGLISYFWTPVLDTLFIFIPLFLIGMHDVFQKRSNILRNYPIIGHLRHILQAIRPQIQQYFIQRDTEEAPFSREQWMLIKERAHHSEGVLPFGTLLNVNAPGYRWIAHSMAPKPIFAKEEKFTVGNHACKQPYLASRLNISALSYGALSDRAIRALNRGAKLGGFAHNTGEGGLTPYHLAE